MESFPTDITENILFRLSVEEALQAKRVCTTWKSLLRNYISRKVGFLFSRSDTFGVDNVREELFYDDEYDHYDSANINYYHTDKTLSKVPHSRFIAKSYPIRDIMVGSCNGLTCFRVRGADRFLICNPLTGESIFLPEFHNSESHGGVYVSVGSGFGYCASTNSYKVVKICYHPVEEKEYIHVYTIGGKWRSVGYIGRHRFDNSIGTYANGALYWSHQIDYKLHESEVVAFDLEGEKFDSIPMPRFNYDNSGLFFELKLIGGNNSLHLACTNFKAFCSPESTEIWAYTKNGIDESGTSYTTKDCNQNQNDHNKSSSCWIKEFSIQHKKGCWCVMPFKITTNNEVLFFIDYSLCRYDPKSSTLNCLWNHNVTDGNIESTTHTQSLISLKDLGETEVTYLKDLERLMLQEDVGKDDVTCYGDAPILRTEDEDDSGEQAKPREAKRSRYC